MESLNGANGNERGSSVVARFKNYCIYLYEVDFENLDFFYADLAQLVELLICNQWVGSSSLSIGTSFKPLVFQGFLFYLAYLIHHKNSVFIPF